MVKQRNNDPEPMAINIVTFMWADWPDGEPDWAPEYLKRLMAAIDRNLKTSHRYICYTDRKEPPFERENLCWRPFPSYATERELPGCMRKTIVYNQQETGFHQRTWLVDLDMIFVGDLKTFALYTGPWCGVDNLRASGAGLAGGGFVSFDPGACNWIWHEAWQHRKAFCGKERFFYRHLQDTYSFADTWQRARSSDIIVSYKWRVRKDGAVPDKTRVVHFHGQPRPHAVTGEPFMQKHWRGDNK